MEAYATSSQLKVNQQSNNSNFQAASIPANAYAFFFRWNSIEDAKLLSKLLNKNIKVRFSKERIRINGKTFDPGTLIITKRDNKQLGETFEASITKIANNSQQTFEVVATGFMDGGPDLGSRNVSFIKKPKIAMLRGEGISTTNYGATWFYMEQEIGYPFTAINTTSLNRVNLAKYDVLIMQEGRYGNLGKSEMEKITTWVKSGGKLIAIGSSIRKFADSDFSSLSRYNSDEEKKEIEKKEEAKQEENKLLPYSAGQREYAKEMIPGAIFKVTLDKTHPLAYGYGDYFYTLKTSASRYGYLDGQNVGIIKSSNDLMSGFAGQYVKEAVGKSMVMGVENKGRGEIVYFVDNPLFRAFWHDYKLMVANALFLVGQN